MMTSRRISVLNLFAALLLGMALVAWPAFQAQSKLKGKPAPPQPALPQLMTGDIITTESDALSVWRYSSNVPIWTKTTSSSYYNQGAVGDVNSDGKPEIVVPVSKGNASPFKIFVDVYKEGSGTPISSENYSPGYFTDGSRVICDVTIANVIPENGAQINEIVLQHWYNLVIFRWDGTNYRIMKRIQARFMDLPIIAFNGTTTINFDGDPEEEVLTSGQDVSYGAGTIYEIDLHQDASYDLTLVDSTEDLAIDGNAMGIGHSLRVADLDGDSALEICLPGLLRIIKANVSYWKTYLLVWDQGQWNSIIIPGYETEKDVNPSIYLDISELNNTLPGDEIALYVNQQVNSDYRLYVFKYPFLSGAPWGSRSLQNASSIGDIKIGDIQGGNKIVVCGNAPPPKGKTLRKYFEVFDPFLYSYWQVFSGSGSMIDLAIVK